MVILHLFISLTSSFSIKVGVSQWKQHGVRFPSTSQGSALVSPPPSRQCVANWPVARANVVYAFAKIASLVQAPCAVIPGPRQYIMFDQIRGMADGFLSHPTPVLYDVSTSSSTLCRPDSPELYKKGGSLQHLQETLLRTTSAQATGCDLRMTSCREMVASAYVALQKKASSHYRLPGNDQILGAFPDVGIVPRSSEDESSEVGGGFVHEDIDDLETLGCCSSDEEKSMGSAPSELICHLGPPPPPVVDKSSCEPPASRRKRGCEELDEGEVESRLNTKRQKSEESDASHGFSSPAVSIIGTVSAKSRPVSDGGKSSPREDCLDQSADELQMLCDDFGFEMPEQQLQQQCSSCSKEGGGGSISESSGSARQSRRQKIKATVKLLREAIPGGDCMDTAIVLDEAIHYVKLLQLQVQTMGAKRLAQRAAR